jgi:hypothetical protein
MRTVEARMIQAILQGLNNAHHAGRLLKCGNTEVTQEHHGIAHTPGYYREIEVRLHGNLIGVIEPDIMRIRLDDCGYRTATTKSRLNALLRAFVPGEGIGQQDFTWYATGGLWQGSDEWRIRLDADNYFLQQAARIAA